MTDKCLEEAGRGECFFQTRKVFPGAVEGRGVKKLLRWLGLRAKEQSDLSINRARKMARPLSKSDRGCIYADKA